MIRQILGRAKTGLKAVAGLRFDALDVLRADHMRVERLAVELRLTPRRNVDKRKRLLAEIRAQLDRHMRVEEEVLYPTCARIAELGALIDHAYTDHQLAKNALKDLEVMDPKYGRFDELMTKVIKEVLHHVAEEENRVFGGIRRHMSPSDFRDLSDRIIGEFRGERPAARAA